MQMPLPAAGQAAAVVRPSVTDWISAVSTAALGVLGIFVTIWQWRRSGFCPHMTSRIDHRREAIELQVVNTGRAAGIISQINVVEPDPQEEEYVIVGDVTFEGFRDEEFRPVTLPALTSMLLIIKAPANQPFSSDVQLAVGGGTRKPRFLTPAKAPRDLGIAGLISILPPGTQP
jgi:hypothetical protein